MYPPSPPSRYAPRKPRYFNRIHTGYEWNKYNQTHYDTENPPPKVVQGYKFNIFYPDLLDKTHAPTYRCVKHTVCVCVGGWIWVCVGGACERSSEGSGGLTTYVHYA